MAANLPVAFGAVVAGGLLVTHGLSAAKAAFAAAPAAGAAASTMLPGGGSTPVNTKGLANPIPGFSIGRTDAGIDASASPGSPIYALAASTLVEVLPGWYGHGNPNGGPLYLFKTDQPGAVGGHDYWYIAEQIAPSISQGQRVAAGQQIGSFASSGTGIEIGIGDPTSNSRTLAGAQGQGDGGGAGTDAGRLFRSILSSLGAKV